MVRLQVSFVILGATLALAVPVRQQCGGIGWKGSTECVDGETCVKITYDYFECQRTSDIPRPQPQPIFITSLTRSTVRPSYTPRAEERDVDDASVTRSTPRPIPTFTRPPFTVKPPVTCPPIPFPTWSISRSTVRPTYSTRPPISIPTSRTVTRTTVRPTYVTRPTLTYPTTVTRTTVAPTYTTRPALDGAQVEGITLISLSRSTPKPTFITRRSAGEEPERPVDPPVLTIPVPGVPPIPTIPSDILTFSLTRTTSEPVFTPRVEDVDEAPERPVDQPVLTVPVPGSPGQFPPIPSGIFITSITRTASEPIFTPRVEDLE